MAGSNKSPFQLPIASVEADWLGSLFGFHNKTMRLLRQSSLEARFAISGVDFVPHSPG